MSRTPKSTSVDAKKARTPTSPSAVKRTSAVVSHGSVLLTDLPANLPAVYTRIVRRFFPRESRQISEAILLEEADNATMSVEVPSKEVAQKLFKRLQNAKVCGRRWKVQYIPASEVQCRTEACLVSCFLIPPAPRSVAERALSTVPGFLAFVDEANGGAVGAASSSSAEPQKVASEENDSGNVHLLVATFVDEGSALHARAVLSGRLAGSSGVRLFLKRR